VYFKLLELEHFDYREVCAIPKLRR
jgi:hypothetical protein